jgi:hypothetical protein
LQERTSVFALVCALPLTILILSSIRKRAETIFFPCVRLSGEIAMVDPGNENSEVAAGGTAIPRPTAEAPQADIEQVPAAAPARAVPAVAASTAFYQALNGTCGAILVQSLVGDRAIRHGKSHAFLAEITTWLNAIGSRPETFLLKSSAREWQHSLLALAQGQYSQAFRGLRLVLELDLQAIYLSSRAIELREWLESRKDTVWGEITDTDNGVFSARFASAFAPELEAHRKHYGGLATKLYRECSECVHGNVPQQIALPETFEFSDAVFGLWHQKADVAALIVTFGLCLRYFRELGDGGRTSLEAILLDRLGHLPEVRAQYGAVGSES